MKDKYNIFIFDDYIKVKRYKNTLVFYNFLNKSRADFLFSEFQTNADTQGKVVIVREDADLKFCLDYYKKMHIIRRVL